MNTNTASSIIGPALSLDDLATAWLPRSLTRLAAMPGLNNEIGSVQMEADIVSFKHPVFPPYSGGGEATGMTLINGKNLAQCVEQVEIRWKAFEVERRCRTDDWLLASRTALLPDQPGVVVELTVTNGAEEARELSLAFLLSGRSRNTGSEGYAWAVPTVPTDVFSFTKNEGLAQSVSRSSLPDGVVIANDLGNGHTTQCVWPSADQWSQERIPKWRRVIPPGGRFTVTLLCTFHADKAAAETLAKQWHGDAAAIFAASRRKWESLWTAAFTPGNSLFSGSLPRLRSPDKAMNELYYNGVLTLLTCRRRYPHAVLGTCYITIWPRRGEGSAYLAWELPYTSGILARLDPDVLREMLVLLMGAPFMDYQVTNYFTGEHGGWACSSQPMAVFTASMNLMRWAGETSWQTAKILVKARSTRGFEAASQGQILQTDAGEAHHATGLEVFREAVLAHRTQHVPGCNITSFGDRGAYLECITTYAHGTAGHTASQAAALEEAATMLGLDSAEVEQEVAQLRRAVLSLYRPGEGHFDCLAPNGMRVPAANLYDIGLVLNAMGPHLPKAIVEEIVAFARRELLTSTWTRCLAPTDLDVLSGQRCDHQWAGCYPAWPAQFIMGLLRTGYRAPWMTEWLANMAKLTRQGPFAQAYWAEDVFPAEAGGATKCFDELTQGNHWVIGSGVYIAEMILCGICGVNADLRGHLHQTQTLAPWSNEAHLTGLRTARESCDMVAGRLIPSPRSSQPNEHEAKTAADDACDTCT